MKNLIVVIGDPQEMTPYAQAANRAVQSMPQPEGFRVVQLSSHNAKEILDKGIDFTQAVTTVYANGVALKPDGTYTEPQAPERLQDYLKVQLHKAAGQNAAEAAQPAERPSWGVRALQSLAQRLHSLGG